MHIFGMELQHVYKIKSHLKNLVSMEALSNEEVMALIKRGIEFKNGAKKLIMMSNISCLTSSLSRQHVRTKHLKWLS